jgi:hypothetical protein
MSFSERLGFHGLSNGQAGSGGTSRSGAKGPAAVCMPSTAAPSYGAMCLDPPPLASGRPECLPGNSRCILGFTSKAVESAHGKRK